MTSERTFPQRPQHQVPGDPASITEVELLNELERRIFYARRTQRNFPAITLLLVVVVFLCAAVTIQNTDLDIQPNQVAGDPDDSYELKLIGDGSSGADVEMTLKTVPTTDSEYRLAISDNGGTERFTFDDDGNLSIGTTSASSALHVDSNAAGTTAVATFENTPGDFQLFVTNADPESAITANIGDLALDGTNGNMWIKHEGAGNTGWDRLGTRNPYFVHDGSGNQTINGTEITLNLNTVIISDPTYSLASDVITFNEDGVYKVTVEVGWELTNTSGGPDASVEVTVQEDTGGGFTDITYALSGSIAGETARSGGDMWGTVQTWMRSFNNGDKIRVRLIRDTGTENLDTRDNWSFITIERVN